MQLDQIPLQPFRGLQVSTEFNRVQATGSGSSPGSSPAINLLCPEGAGQLVRCKRWLCCSGGCNSWKARCHNLCEALQIRSHRARFLSQTSVVERSQDLPFTTVARMARKRKQPEAATASQNKVEEGVSAKATAKVADSLASSKYTGPFPDHQRPTSQECRVGIPHKQMFGRETLQALKAGKRGQVTC